MAFTSADLLAIKAELTNDPQSLGLVAPPTIDDVGNADKLNDRESGLLIDRTAIPTSEIFVQIDRDEYAALAETDRDWLEGVSQGGTVNPKDGGEVREGLLQLFGQGTDAIEPYGDLAGARKPDAANVRRGLGERATKHHAERRGQRQERIVTDADTAREIARDIALVMLEKTGVQEWTDATTTKEISKRAVEMARFIIDQFPQPKGKH